MQFKLGILVFEENRNKKLKELSAWEEGYKTQWERQLGDHIGDISGEAFMQKAILLWLAMRDIVIVNSN